MEYCAGKPITDTKYMKDNNIDTNWVSEKLNKLIGDMIFKHGFVHCDPHPGNILVSKNKSTGNVELTLLDHGLYRVSLHFSDDVTFMFL